MTRSIYLDFNSTSPVSTPVRDAMNECHAHRYLNPASLHREGRRAKARLEQARERILELLGGTTNSASADRLILTSGGTEANNLALRGLAGRAPGRILVSSVEHPSISETASQLAENGFDVVRLPVDRQGVVVLDALDELLTPSTRVVSVMVGNNETGVLQPIGEIAKRCAKVGTPLHTDAVQAIGKIPVDFSQLQVSAMTVTAHKFYGPRAIGGLLLAHRVDLQPIIFGGGQQLGSRPGTESVALAVGFETALTEAMKNLADNRSQLEQLRDQLQQLLRAKIPGCVVNGGDADRLPHTLNVSFPGLDRQSLLMALDQHGVACSTGSTCASGSSQPSPVLLAMGCDDQIVNGSLRLSLGISTTSDEVVEASQIMAKIVDKMSSF